MSFKKDLLLFFSLERYAFLILSIQIICGILEIFNIKYVSSPYYLIYLIPHIIAGIYFFIKMVILFSLWPKKKRFHNITIHHYEYMKSAGKPISRSKLSAMNSPCEKITRDTVYKIIEES